MRKTLLLPILCIIILSLFSVFSYASEWESFQHENDNSAFQNPSYYNIISDGDTTTYTGGYGDIYQRLTSDIDNDGVMEIVTSTGNFTQILTFENNVVSLKDERLMDYPQDSIGWLGNIDDDDLIEYVVSFNQTIWTLKYNGSEYLINNSYKLPNGNQTVGGITCALFSTTWFCYGAASDNHMFEYEPNSGIGAIYDTGENLSENDADRFAPYIADVDNDGNQEIGFIIIDGFIAVDQNTKAVDFTIDYSAETNAIVRGYLAFNLDGAGDIETCITRTRMDGANANDAILACYNGDGSSFQEILLADNSNTNSRPVVSSPVIMDVEGDFPVSGSGGLELCAMGGLEDAEEETHMICYSGATGTLVVIAEYTNLTKDPSQFMTSEWDPTKPTTKAQSASLRGENQGTVTLGKGFFFYNDTLNNLTFMEMSTFIDGDTITTDLDNDGFLEVIQGSSGSTFVYKNSITNEIPELNNSLSYGGYGANYDYTLPICVGSTIIFTASECGQPPCNYVNDVDTDRERLVSNCGTNASGLDNNMDNGSYALSNPSFSCYYNTTGAYSVRIYLQDEQNSNDLTQFNTETIFISVIEGSQGSQCGFVGFDAGDTEPEDVQTPAQEQQEEAVEDVMSALTGGNQTIQLIAGLALILAFVLIAAAYTQNSFVLIVSGFIGTALVSFLGLIPLWVMIMLMLVMFIVGFLTWRTHTPS